MKLTNVLSKLFLLGPLKSKKLRKIWFGFMTLALLFALGSFITSCNYYQATTMYAPPPGEIMEFKDLGKQFVVHYHSVPYNVISVIFFEDSLALNIEQPNQSPNESIAPAEPNGVKRYRLKKGDARLLNEVHLYITGNYESPESLAWELAYSDIERIDVYNHSTRHTVAYSILFGIAMLPAAYLALMAAILLMLLLTGNSCPFIYTWNGTEFEFAGEIYSGAVYEPLERNDYLLLSNLAAEDGEYLLQITNELEEIQHTNLLELLVFDHPDDEKVLVDKYGSAHLLGETLKPLSAKSSTGLDILPLVESRDDHIWVGQDPMKNPPLLEGIELSFEIPEGIETVELLLEAKNSYWLDFVYKNFRDMLGSSYDMWMKKQKKGDPDKMISWSLSQHIPLSVYIMKDGEWIFQDYFNTSGPMMMKEDVLSLSLEGLEEGPLRIKLEAGSFFWEIGCVNLDINPGRAPEARIISLDKATDENDRDVRPALLHDDEQYYNQPEIGNMADLVFTAPEQSASRTIVLHSKGYYEILSNSEGAPQLKALQKIRKPGNFNSYSNELMQLMLKEHLNTHGEHSEN